MDGRASSLKHSEEIKTFFNLFNLSLIADAWRSFKHSLALNLELWEVLP